MQSQGNILTKGCGKGGLEANQSRGGFQRVQHSFSVVVDLRDADSIACRGIDFLEFVISGQHRESLHLAGQHHIRILGIYCHFESDLEIAFCDDGGNRGRYTLESGLESAAGLPFVEKGVCSRPVYVDGYGCDHDFPRADHSLFSHGAIDRAF